MALLDGNRPTLVAPAGATGRDIWHALPGAQVFDALGGTPSGLTEAEAKTRLVRTGPNRLPQEKRRSSLKRYRAQFNNLLIYVLLAAVAGSLAIGHCLGWRGRSIQRRAGRARDGYA